VYFAKNYWSGLVEAQSAVVTPIERLIMTETVTDLVGYKEKNGI
jgi:hypothetical protein